MQSLILVNFGGPRNLEEIPAFLTALLQDRDVIRTKLPSWMHNFLFRRIALRRAKKTAHDYEAIGGKSPIYFDTEMLAEILALELKRPVVTFHRYLPDTHKKSIEAIEELTNDRLTVLPLFPQFSYATTGSIARFFTNHLRPETVQKLRWIRSYAHHEAFISAHERHLASYLKNHGLSSQNTALLFSAHGLPLSFIETGDTYQAECERSYFQIMKRFPGFVSRLAYQSKFGRGEWLRPSTEDICLSASTWNEGKEKIVIIPLSFTSDHIETLFEIEQLYLPLLQNQGLQGYRCPALNLEPYWIQALAHIAQDTQGVNTQTLIFSN